MADVVEQRLECALNSLVNIAETGGYLNKGTKEDIYKAVSDIRKCFLKLQCTAGYKNEAE